MEEQTTTQTPSSDDGLKKIYNKNVEWGYKGTFDQFSSYFNENDDNKRKVYDFNVKNGYKGSYDDFISFAGAGQAKQQPTRYQLPTFQPYQRELDDSPASILSPTQLKIARGEIGEGDTYTLQPGEDIEAFTPLPNFTIEQTEEERQQRQQQPKPQRQTMRDGSRMLGHNAALTRLAQDNGIATQGFENLNELGEDAMKIYALTPQGKADKQNMDNAAELAYDDFTADYLKNGSDPDIKAQLELGRQKQLLEQENAALAKDIEAWKAHHGTEQQLNALNARIRDLNKRIGAYEAAVASSHMAQEKVNEAFQKWLENDDYYKAVAQQYEQNYEATMGDWFDRAATPLYMQMTKDEIAKMKAYLDDESLNLDHRQRTAIKRRVKDAEAWVKAAEKNGWLDKTFAGMQGKGAGIDIATMFRGMGNAIDFDLLDYGIGEAIDDATLRRISEKVRDKGEASLTPEERAVLLSDEALGLTKSVFNVDESAWNAGANTAEMLPFIVELWLSGGANAAIKAGVKGAVKGGAKGFRQGLKAGWKAAMKPTASQLGRLGEAGRFAPKSVGQVAKEVGMTAAEIVDNGLFYAMTTGLGHSVANTLEYMTPEVDADFDFGTGKWNIKGIAVDEQGNIKGGDKLGLAALKGFGMQAIEGGSEMLGEKALQPLLDRGGYWLRGMMGRQGRAMYKPYLRVVDDWIGHGALKNISGFGTEYAEELAGSAMRVITGLSTWDQEFNKQNLADTAYGLMPAQVAFAILGGGRMVGHARRSSQAKDLLDKYAPEQAAFYDRVAKMSTYDGADMLDRKTLEILKTIDEKKNNGTLTEEDQRKAAAELGMIFTMQEQIYMDEASAYTRDKQGRRMYEGITSNLNENGMFTVYEWNHDGTTERVPVLSTKDGKATVRLWNGKKQTVDLKDLSFVGEYTPEQAMQFAGERQTEFDDYAYRDQTTPMAGSVYYDADGNIPIVPGKGEVNITEVADNGDVTFTTDDGTTQTMNERKFYDYMRALRDAYEVTAGQLAAWRVEADTKGKTAAENDDLQAHYGVGREARMARRALANAIGEERMAELERMDGEQLTREYMMADEKTQDLMYDWMQNRVGDSYGEAMNQRRQQAMVEWKQRIGRLPYDNGNCTTAVHNGNIVIVEDNDGQQAAIVDMQGNKSMVQSSELSNMQDNSLDSVAAQATMPQQAQLTALEQAYNGTTFQAGQEYTIGTDVNGEERKAIIVSVNGDGTISYATEYGYDKEGNPTPAARSVKVATAEGFRDMTENARQQRATQEQGQQEAAQQRADMGELRNGQRVTIMDGGHPVQGTVNMPYTGQVQVFTDTQKLIKFDSIDDLKKSMQDAANALQAEQQVIQAAVQQQKQAEIDAENAIENEYQKRFEAAKTPKERAQVIQEYLDQIKTEDFTMITNDNLAGVLVESMVKRGIKQEDAIRLATRIQSDIQTANKSQQRVRGFNHPYTGICIHPEDIVSIEDARTTYVHERQHTITRNNVSLQAAVLQAASKDELDTYIAVLSGSPFYKGKDNKTVASEFLSMAMEVAYKSSDVGSALRQFGIENDALIQIITQLDNEQRTDEHLSKSRRTAHVDGSQQGDNRNDDENKGREPGRMDGQGPRPIQRGGEQTGSRQEVKTPEQLLEAFIAKHGDNTENKLNKTIESISGDIRNLEKKLATAEQELKDLPEAYNDKAKKAIDKKEKFIEKVRNDLEAARKALAPYTAMKEVWDGLVMTNQTRLNEADQALQDLDKNLNPTVEAEEVHKFDKEPANADEAAADFLVGFVKKQHRINEKSLMQETGWSEDEVKNFRPATTPDGGMTLQEAGENLYNEYESKGSEHGWFKDPSEARDKLISVMQEAGKYGELTNYINQRRGNDEATQQMQAAIDANAQQLGYADAQDMHDKRMAEAQAKLEELKDEQGNLSEEALQQFKDFTQGLMIVQKETPAEQPTESIEEGEEFIQPTNEEAPFSVAGGTRYSITHQQDAAYMDAVKRGDMETAQRMVLEAAKAAMPNTKVVDENGNPKIVYHQTNWTIYRNRETGQIWDELDWREQEQWDDRDDWEDYWIEEDFYTFSRKNARTTNELDGFFFAPEYDEYHGYGDRTIASFVNIENPASQNDYHIDATYNDAGRNERIRMQQEGYDGVINTEDGEVVEYVAFEPSQIKSADPVTYDDEGNVIPLSKRFNKRSDDIRFSIANRNQAVFVSNAARAVESIKQEKATPEQWLKMIEKQGGLKAGEDKWLGLSQWLKDSEAKTLTKQQVLDFINENAIKIEEVRYADASDNMTFEALKQNYDYMLREEGYDYAWEQLREQFGDDADIAFTDIGGELEIANAEAAAVLLGSETPINSTRLNYTTEGLDNKREIALTVPTIEPWNEGDDIHFGDAGGGRAVAWIRFGETTDADGNRVLVIDEIQSKRHQEGREKGYKKGTKEDVRKANEATIDAQIHYDTYISDLAEKYNCDRADVYAHATDAEIEEAEARMDAVSATMRAYEQVYEEANGIPQAPFEKNWMELAMKRMLRLAAEEGYGKVAWTTGEQQAKRYSLSTTISKIEKERKNRDITYVDLTVADTNGIISLEVNNDGVVEGVNQSRYDNFVGQPLSNVIGKEWADEVLNSRKRTFNTGEMAIGGEGMKGFYDKMLPSFMNKYGKQWGVKVDKVTMPNLEEGYQTMHSIDVTDAMKESVMSGQLMFSFVGRSGAQRLDMADRAMTRLNNLHVAREMEEQGKDAKAVKMATGWERGKDGKWRYEISDENYRFDRSGLTKFWRDNPVPKEMRDLVLKKGRTEEETKRLEDYIKERQEKMKDFMDHQLVITLEDVIAHDELFKAYPQLKNIKVTFTDTNSNNYDRSKGTLYGYYDDRNKEIVINKNLMNSEKRSTLIHEIQHAIQYIEGFAKGGNPSTTKQAVDDVVNNAKIWGYKLELDGVAKDHPEHADSEQELLYDILFDYLGYENDGQAEYNARKDGWIPEENLRKQAFKIFQGRINGEAYEKAYEKYIGRMQERGSTQFWNGTPFELYKRLAGETEARNVQTRLRFTEEQRRQLLAAETEDVAREDQLVMFAGDPVLYSVSQAANTPQERLRLYDAMNGEKYASNFVGRVTEGFYRSVVDGAIPLKRLQDVIAGRGKVTDAENAYLMEIARAARAKRLTDIAETKYYEPMMKAIAALTGKTSKKGYYKAMRDVELYVLAKSGLERNQWFWDEAKKSDPNAQLEDKSGLTALAAEFGEKDFTAFAERLVADYEARHGQQKIDELWKCINAVSKNILDTELDGHLISQELHDDLLNRWKFYVPMRGFDEPVTSAYYFYQPSSATIRFENPFKKIKGRVSLADNPFVNLIRMTESAINLKGKNEVGLALLNLAASHDDNGLLRVGKAWEVKEVDPATGEVTWKAAYPKLSNVSQADIPAAIDAFQKSMMRQAKTGDARPSSRTAGGVRIHPTDIDQHVLKVKVGGQTVDLYLLGNPKAFQALNPTGKSKAGEKLSGLTRSLSGLMTTYNPVFMVRNSIRDFKTAAIITYTRDGAAGMFNMMGQWFGNMNALRKLIKGESSGDATLDRYWQEFLEFGGETGFTRSLNMEKQREDFNKKMFNLTRDKSGQAMHKITHWYFDWMREYGNRYAEDITRFAVFCASRKQGRSAMQAAADAKNTTANFNKKGQSGFARFMSTNYAFFNAAIQGLNTSFHAFKDNPGRAATAAVSTMIFSMAIPYVNMCLLAMFGDDDDWRQYENMTQFVSNTHAVYYIPGAGFLTIPYPQDFVPFTSLGNIIWRNTTGFEKPLNGRSIFGNVMLQWFDTWADLLPVNAFEEGFGEMKDWKGVARALAPTWLSPVADVMLNRNFMGSQIRRKHFTLNDQKDLAPYWAEYDRSKNWWAHDIARLIAGGDEYRAAAAWRNVDPRQLIHLVEGYGGGTVKLVSDIAVYFEEMAKGDKPTLNQAPFIKKFWIQPNPDKYEGNLNGKLYEMAKYQRELEQQIKDLQKEADKAREDGNDKAAEKREKKIEEIQNSMEYKILTDYDVNGKMKKWREERNDITNDGTLSEEGKQDKIVTLTYQKAAFLDGIWEEAFLGEEAPKRNWFSDFYYDKKGEQE